MTTPLFQLYLRSQIVPSTLVVTTIYDTYLVFDWMTMTTDNPASNEHTPLTDLAFHIMLALGDGASHGYAIGKDVETRSGGRLNPATGGLYQALRRLREDGLIEKVKPKPGDDRDPRRQYFRLTPLGRQVFQWEARRMEGLLSAAREKKLIPGNL